MNEYIDQNLYDEILANSNVVTGDEYRKLVCTVAQIASDVVVKTLGPYGATTVIDDGSGITYPTKDGWACLSRLQFIDPIYNTIFQMLKKISFNSVTTVGDGTTTAMVVANNFLKELYTEFIPKVKQEGSFRQADFVETMIKTSKVLEDKLKSNSNIKIIDSEGDFHDIWKIAYVATNGNKNFANIIQSIYQETKNPNIQVVMDKVADTNYEIQKGYRFEAKTLNFRYYVNDQSNRIVFNNKPCKMVIFDHNVMVSTHDRIISAYSMIAKNLDTSVIILAPYFDDIITTTITSQVQRMVQQNTVPNIILVQVPIVMDIQRKTLYDLSVLTGAQTFDEPKVKAFNLIYHNQTHSADQQIKDRILELEEFVYANSPQDILERCMGTVQNIVINSKEGFLMDYNNIAKGKEFKAILSEVEEEYKEAKTKAMKTIGGTLDKEFLYKQMRYIKLKGSTGVIHVGGLSEIQQRCDKDSLEDAVLACRSAFENGYVRGMNLEILSIIYNMIFNHNDDMKENIYEYEVLMMLYKSFYNTCIQMMMNKYPGFKSIRSVNIIEDNLQSLCDDLSNEDILDLIITCGKNYDYNLRTEEMNPPESWEVINSTDTDIEILRAVVNVLTTVITSSQFLSINRRFDAKVNNEKSMNNRLDDDKKILNNKLSVVKDFVRNNYETIKLLK